MSLIFIDRSRYVRRLGHCQMASYYSHHYANVGIRQSGLNIPLATGTHTHDPATAILQQIIDGGEDIPTLPSSQEIEIMINASCDAYRQEVTDRGFCDLEDTTTVDHIMMEQCYLVGGLSWAWATEILPRFIEEFHPIAVEQEFELILGCTCGLSGVGEVQLHQDRACRGVVFMTRPDIIARSRATGSLSYHEIKTGGYVDRDSWGEEFKDDIQSSVGCAAAEHHFDQAIEGFYVHGLHKGSRKSRKVDGAWTKMKYQESPLCYAYVRSAAAPMIELDIKPYFNWIDEDGKSRKCGKLYHKTPAWEIEGVQSVTDYLHLLTPDIFARNVKIAGPYDTNRRMIKQLLDEVLHEEQDWTQKVAMIRTAVDETGSESHDEVLGIMTEMIPRSWDCKSFYGRDCEFKMMCFQHEGWQDPLQTTHFELREPNHPIERMSGLWEERE